MDIQAVRDHAPAAPVQQGAPAAPPPAATPPTAHAAPPAAEPAPAELAQALKHINQAIKSMSPGIEFSFDEDAHTTVVKVVDVNTKEVLRQMPSAEALEIAKTLDKLQGLLIRQQA
jgi:flagellar protein FlaG